MTFYKDKRVVGFFVLVNILYLTQGIFPPIDMLYKLMLFFIMAFSLVYAHRVNKEYGNSSFIKVLNILVAMITVYGIMHIMEPLDSTLRTREGYRAYTYITNAYRPLLQIYPLYYFSRKGYLDEEVIKSWIIPSFIAAAIAYYVKQTVLIEELAIASDEIDATNNMGYLMVTLFPLLYFIDTTYIKYALLAVISIFVVSSAKRGAILIAGLSVMWFVYNDLRTASKKKKIWVIGFVAITGFFLIRYVSMLFEDSDYLQFLLEKTLEGNSSGRDVLYTNAKRHFLYNSSLFVQLFGNGADSTYNILGNRAHNDWLEFLINQGIFGVSVYALFWFQILRSWIKSWKKGFIFIVLTSVIIVFFPRTVLSMFYNDISPIACMPFAWCIAMVDSKSLKNRSTNKKKLCKLSILTSCV